MKRFLCYTLIFFSGLFFSSRAYAGPPSADFNGDGFVTGDDYDAYVVAFVAGKPEADFNKDGFVNGDDYDQFLVSYQGQRGPYVNKDGWTIVPDWEGCRVLRLPMSYTMKAANEAVARLGVDLDKVLFPRGSVGQVSLRLFHGGKDLSHPVVIGAYGDEKDPRPILTFDSSTTSAIECSGGGGTDSSVSNVYVMSLDIKPLPRDNREGREGVRVILRGSNWEFFDVRVDGCKDNFNVQGYDALTVSSFTNFRFRRVQSLNSWSASGSHSQGLFCVGVDGLLVEESFFCHNGWLEGKPGAEATIFNHNFYLRENVKNVRIINNIIAYSSSHGVNMQMSGEISGNLFVGCPVPIFCRTMDTKIYNNVITESRDINGLPRGMGIFIGGAFDVTGKPGPCFLRGNVITHRDAKSVGRESPIRCGSEDDGLKNLVSVLDTIAYDWPSDGKWFDLFPAQPPHGGEADLYSIGGEQVALSGPPLPSWPFPGRTVASYSEFIGTGGTIGSFLANVVDNRMGDWKKELTASGVCDYIRAGFGK